ncbi:chain length determinant family protein [Collimonas fungivorans]|uniref:Chain length determinant family protein n=1 Tax=Collimonas fungivorans TaxID=158899 RepID=A0A127PHD0_9BURK|nr:hypothetical protein [Collimonas fungivorans]AMO97133.1 chain length determinant family protein [Collimonas fungivorans]
MTESIHPSASQLTLSTALKRHLALLAACSVAGALAAYGTSYMIPKQWPATLLFQVGQIGSGANLLVDPNNVVQRVKFPGFVNQVLQAEQLPTDESLDRRSALIKKTLAASIAKGGNLLEMSVKGYSPEEAKANLLAAFHMLQAEHAELLLPSVTRLEKNLADARTSLQRIEDEHVAVLEPIKKVNSAGTIERKFSESILLASMLKSNESERRVFRDQINGLDEQLSPYRTFNTKSVAPAYVPQHAVYPRKSIAAAIGLILGFMLAGLYALVRDKELQGAIARTFRE